MIAFLSSNGIPRDCSRSLQYTRSLVFVARRIVAPDHPSPNHSTRVAHLCKSIFKEEQKSWSLMVPSEVQFNLMDEVVLLGHNRSIFDGSPVMGYVM